MADDHMHEFPEQAKPVGDETSSSGNADEPEINPEDYYRAYDERMELLFGSDRLKICGWLNIGYDSVTADDLARACLSDDVQTQAVRLQSLFEMCGLVGEAHSVERAELIKRLAEAGPQSITEMQVLFQAIATDYMAARCAADAMRPGQSFEVMSLQLGNFGKAAKMGTQLREADLLGGGARSTRWSQILADVLGMPLHQIEGGEHGCALGAARLARTAAGGEASYAKPQRLRSFEPNPQRVAFYNQAHARWRGLYSLARQVPTTPSGSPPPASPPAAA